MCSADDDDEFRSWSVQPSNKEQKKKQIGGRHFLLGIPNGAETKVPDSFWTFVELRWAIVPTPESRDTRPTHSRRRQATKVIKSAIKKKSHGQVIIVTVNQKPTLASIRSMDRTERAFVVACRPVCVVCFCVHQSPSQFNQI